MQSDLTAAQNTRLEQSIRGAVLSLPCLVLSVAVILFAAVMVPGGLLARLTLAERIAIYAVSLAVFLWHSRRFLPPLVRWCLRRGWPLAPLQIALYLPLAAVTALIFPLLQGQVPTPKLALWTFAAGCCLIILAAVMGLLMFQAFMLPQLGLPVTARQLWLGSAKKNRADAWLPANLRGAPVLRMSLSHAVSQLSEHDGLRIHRSHWVARSEMTDLRYRNGNPYLILTDGSELPVSRSHIGAVRAALADN